MHTKVPLRLGLHFLFYFAVSGLNAFDYKMAKVVYLLWVYPHAYLVRLLRKVLLLIRIAELINSCVKSESK
jgi:hypothetical protein